jgi:hypothetical protein
MLPSRELEFLVSSVGARQEVRTDHLQTIATRLVGPEHERRRFDGFLDDRQLTLVELEVDNLPRLRFLPVRCRSTSPLNPSFAIPLALCNQVAQSKFSPSLLAHFDQFHRFAPSHLSEVGLGNPCRIFMDRHQVVSLSARFREPPF